MTITFLVGNGFDIAAGLNTSYSGFYDWYIKRPPRTADKNNAIKTFKNEIDSYMHIKDPTERGKARWADFETGLGQYTEKFTKDNVDDFLELYEDAHEELCTYLENELSKFDIVLTDPSIIARLREGVSYFYKEIKPTERDLVISLTKSDPAQDTRIKFISFNYTNSIDSIIKELSREPLQTWESGGLSKKMIVMPTVLHVHGTTNNAPIVGVFDESQVANKELLKCPGVKQALIKTQSVQIAGERWYNEADQQINNSNIICIWGMSLGATDARWWKKIVSWLRTDISRRVVIFWHMKNPPSSRSFVNYYIEKCNVVRRLCAFSGLSESDMVALESRVHLVINTAKVLRTSFERIPIPATEDELLGFITGSTEATAMATV